MVKADSISVENLFLVCSRCLLEGSSPGIIEGLSFFVGLQMPEPSQTPGL